jgi:hypothetical protein
MFTRISQHPGFVPDYGNRFGFSARTGGASEDVFIDNLSVTTVALPPPTTPEPIISEIMVHNGNGLEDEDFDHSAWLEIYNGTAAAVNLDGWYLTDDAANLTKWRIPGHQCSSLRLYLAFRLGQRPARLGRVTTPTSPYRRLAAQVDW